MGADYLVIAPAALRLGAEALAAYRSANFDTLVVELEDIYDEFNFGLASPLAIRALLSYADQQWQRSPEYVLLAGVNDCPRIMKALVHKLVRNRVRPYYIYQCDLAEGLEHFRTTVAKGIEIMESLIGHTSGFAVPQYVIDAPGGGGKIPLMPDAVEALLELAAAVAAGRLPPRPAF